MDGESEADLRALQGRWLQYGFNENGVDDAPDDHSAPGAVMTVDGRTFRVCVPGQAPILEGTFVLDATTRPKTIIWRDATGSDAGKAFPAIYALVAETFAFVAADEGMAPPADFSTGPGLTLRRLRRLPPET